MCAYLPGIGTTFPDGQRTEEVNSEMNRALLSSSHPPFSSSPFHLRLYPSNALMRPPFVGRRFLNIIPRRRPSATRVLRSLHTFYKRGAPNNGSGFEEDVQRERRRDALYRECIHHVVVGSPG